MHLLAIVNPSVLDGTVPSPVGHGGQRVERDVAVHSPVLEHNRWEGTQPPESTRRHGALRLPDAQPNSCKMGVAGQAEVDARKVPELGKGRVQIQIQPHGNALEQCLVNEYARDIDQDVRVTRNASERVVVQTHTFPTTFGEQRSRLFEAKLGHYRAEVTRVA